MRIYLVGYMGSGKTTLGKKLANEFKYKHVDLDKNIENKYHITIPDIFHRFDEKTFRKLEHESLKETLTSDNIVISTGGGTPCFYDNMEIINKHGVSVYIKMTPDSLLKRLLKAKKKRPLIQKKSPEEIKEFIEQQLDLREPFYNQAHYTIQGEAPDVLDIVNLLRLK
ncbi:MAG: shikimate kinase [Bacteroidales bacterium]